jgi:hypothetical protein
MCFRSLIFFYCMSFCFCLVFIRFIWCVLIMFSILFLFLAYAFVLWFVWCVMIISSSFLRMSLFYDLFDVCILFSFFVISFFFLMTWSYHFQNKSIRTIHHTMLLELLVLFIFQIPKSVFRIPSHIVYYSTCNPWCLTHLSKLVSKCVWCLPWAFFRLLFLTQ